MMRETIIKAIKEVSGSEDIKLDVPSDSSHGDYATSVALVNAKRQNKNPVELAEEYVRALQGAPLLEDVIEKIEIAGPGFINFFVSDKALADNINSAFSQESKFGSSSEHKGEQVVVEYSSPNIAKPFGIGHFRSTIIGDAVANLLEATGWEVHRDNHLGDWGTQFGKQTYAIKTWGDMEKIENSDNPVKELVALYVKFHDEAEKDPSLEDRGREWFKKLEDGDKEARELWQKCIEWSMKEFGRIYDILGIKFTENDAQGYGESYFEHMMQPVIEGLQEKGLLTDGKEGAKIVEFPNEKYPPLMIVKKDGTTLYATRDLATDKFRLEKYGSDVLIINEVGAEQSLYFQQLFELEKMLGWVSDGQRVHIKHGFFRFKDRKMSTRRGDVVWLEDVINEAIQKAKSFGSDSELAKTVAIGALKWNELKRDPIKDIVFDWDEILTMEGNSGPYLQYTYARAISVLEKAGIVIPTEVEESKDRSFDYAQDDTHKSRVPEIDTMSVDFDGKEKAVARALIHFSQVVKDAANNYSPHILANYLFELASVFNSFYNSERIVGSDREEERLALTKAVGIAIKNGLNLLGIEAPKSM
jgi:arginyl-tRNA synthetase